MGFFNKLKATLGNVFESEFPEDYVENDNEYYTIDEADYDFTYSSVKGDFRLKRLNNGFISGWKNFMVARDWDGNLLYEIYGFGRSLAVSPDAKDFAAISQYKEIAIFDASTGEMKGEAKELDDHLSDLMWTANGHLLAVSSHKVYVFDDKAEFIRSYGENESKEFEFYISSISQDISNAEQIVIFDSDNDEFIRVNYLTGEQVERVASENAVPDELFCDKEHELYWSPSFRGHTIELFDKDLGEKDVLEFEGKEGVRHIGQEEHSSTCWTVLPKLSPCGKRFLVNDKSGLLHLISVHETDHTYRIFGRDTINYVYDTLWQDEDHFIALLNKNRVVRMNIRGMEFLFDKDDSNT